MSADAMKIRNNIEFLASDHYQELSIDTFKELGRIVDYLISAAKNDLDEAFDDLDYLFEDLIKAQ